MGSNANYLRPKHLNKTASQKDKIGQLWNAQETWQLKPIYQAIDGSRQSTLQTTLSTSALQVPTSVSHQKKNNLSTVTHLKIFGNIAYVHIPKTERKKLDTKTRKCIFVRYNADSKIYRVFNPIQKKVELTRDVTVDEIQIGFYYLSEKAPEPITYLPSHSLDIIDPNTDQTQPSDPFAADNLSPIEQTSYPPNNQRPNSPPSTRSPQSQP